MIPTHVALVTYGYEVDKSTLLRVAAALQMQLTRDFTPIWNIPAVVSPFHSLHDIPPGCLPLVIVKPGSLKASEHAFHQTVNDQPLALVEGGDGWWLPASHELLEMVCDPYGKLTVLGDSIADQDPAPELESWADQTREPQGQVAYLVEVADPCQAISYRINGFEVSDFVTPDYYSASKTKGGRYSFTGKVKRPRQVLPRGYITWYTSAPNPAIWQAHRDKGGKLTVGPLPGPAAANSRHAVDYATEKLRGTASSAPARAASGEPEHLAKESARHYGEQLEDDLRTLLKGYQSTTDLEKFLPVLKDVAYNKAKYAKYRKDPSRLIARLQKKGAIADSYEFVGGTFPDQAKFQGAYETLKRRHDREAAQSIPTEAAITAMQGTTIWAPPGR
jgi:hypothetical protein